MINSYNIIFHLSNEQSRSQKIVQQAIISSLKLRSIRPCDCGGITTITISGNKLPFKYSTVFCCENFQKKLSEVNVLVNLGIV